ncbi:MAG: hypothetical protein QM680_13590 [Luteolibacter sp.]
MVEDVSHVSKTLDAFISNTEKHRDEQKREFTLLWEAHNSLGEKLNQAISALSEKNRITVPLIITVATFVLTIVSGAAAIGHLFVSERDRRIESIQDYQRKDIERHERWIEEQNRALTEKALKSAL